MIHAGQLVVDGALLGKFVQKNTGGNIYQRGTIRGITYNSNTCGFVFLIQGADGKFSSEVAEGIELIESGYICKRNGE